MTARLMRALGAAFAVQLGRIKGAAVAKAACARKRRREIEYLEDILAY